MDRQELVRELRQMQSEPYIMEAAADAIEELERDVEHLKSTLRLRAELEWLKQYARESCFDVEVNRDQLRCLWTAFCLHFNYDVDTNEYDTTLRELWEVVAETEEDTADWSDYESFDNYLAKYLC